MDIKELRVGNIIEVNHFEYGDMFASVTSINDIGDLYLHLLDERFTKEEYECTMNEVVPIPITEELLLKIGFKKGQCNGYTSYKINPYDGHIIEVAIFESGIDAFIQYICGACHLRSIKHLHELQNIVFTITGKELEVEI